MGGIPASRKPMHVRNDVTLAGNPYQANVVKRLVAA
jgi:hypothetical protein